MRMPIRTLADAVAEADVDSLLMRMPLRMRMLANAAAKAFEAAGGSLS